MKSTYKCDRCGQIVTTQAESVKEGIFTYIVSDCPECEHTNKMLNDGVQ